VVPVVHVKNHFITNGRSEPQNLRKKGDKTQTQQMLWIFSRQYQNNKSVFNRLIRIIWN